MSIAPTVFDLTAVDGSNGFVLTGVGAADQPRPVRHAGDCAGNPVGGAGGRDIFRTIDGGPTDTYWFGT